MAASTGDKFTDTFNSANPNVARVTSSRTAGATSLSCDNLAGWPTVSKVHFSTYEVDTAGAAVAGTQIDWYGIVSGNTIGSLTRVAGATDNGNAINDVVEMMPTGSWGHDLYDGLTQEHNLDGTHAAVTATSVSTDTISEKTAAAGVTIDGLQVKDSKLVTSDSVVTANITAAAVTPDKLGTGADMAYVATSETTTSTSLTNLTTTTDSVTVTVGANGLALVSVSSYMQNNTANALCKIAIDVSGATTIAASDAYAIQTQFYAANASSRSSGCWLFTGLTPGSTTFKMKYSVTSGGSGSGTGTFANRRIAAVPL